MGMQAGGSKGGALAEMNVVPLIDVLLVLLIIFMVITPSVPAGLQAAVPQAGHASGLENVIVVQISADGGVKINEEPSSWNELGANLQRIFQTRADKVAFIKGDATVDFSEIAHAIDVIHTAGVEHVGLLTERM
jgi:biopolymer transport protein TolR